MMNIENSLQPIINKLQKLLFQLKKICVTSIDNIPVQIEKIVVSENKLPLYVSDDVPYILNEDDLKFVTIIKRRNFRYRTNLTKITIPDSIINIEIGSFELCAKLTDIYLKSITPPSLEHDLAIPKHTTIHVPIGSGEAYRNATNWSSHAKRIVEDPEL